jgi:hypothetical protein
MRIAVTKTDENDQHYKVGHFDHDKAQRFDAVPGRSDQQLPADARNKLDRQILFRTKEGRWVLRDYLSVEPLIPAHSYITDEQARKWLERNEHEEAVRRFFTEVAEDRGPGRPAIGARANIPFGRDRLAAIDTWAQARNISRGEAVRQLLDIALDRQEVSS